MSAQEAAERIVSAYDCSSQIEQIAKKGCGEWEIDRAAEIAEEADNLTCSEICEAVESLCRAKCE